ncbi:hypothetical protein GA0115251_109580 [Streptomyces sp. TverLS-915]|nr:hypothetical protein GA0115251_109580 [Streptomyces sp. TverLS-915]
MPGPLRDVAPPRGVTPVPRCHACAATPCSLPRRHARKRQPAPDVGAYPWKTAVLSLVRDAAPSHREATPVPQCRASSRDAAPRTPAHPMRGAPPLAGRPRPTARPPRHVRTRARPAPRRYARKPPPHAGRSDSLCPPARPAHRTITPTLRPPDAPGPRAPRAPPAEAPPFPRPRRPRSPGRGAPVPPAEAPPFPRPRRRPAPPGRGHRPRPRLALALDAYGGRGGRTAPRTKRPPPLRQNPPPSARTRPPPPEPAPLGPCPGAERSVPL